MPRIERPERMIGPEVRDEDFVHQIVGRVLDHLDLFDHDVAFAVEFFVGKERRGDEVGEQIESARQMLVQHFDVIAGDFAAGESIDVAADGIAFDGDFARGAIACAFEECVFDEVRDAVEAAGFVARARAHPYPDRSGSHVIHLFGDDGETVIEDGFFDGTCLFDHIAPERDASTRLNEAQTSGQKSEVRSQKAEDRKIYYFLFFIFYFLFWGAAMSWASQMPGSTMTNTQIENRK